MGDPPWKTPLVGSSSNIFCKMLPHGRTRGGKIKLRKRRPKNVPQHMTGTLRPSEKYHSKDSWFQKLFKESKRGAAPLVPL